MEVTGLPYGQNQALNDVMGAAAMGGQPPLGRAPSGQAPAGPQAPTGLNAPSTRPNEPVTAGADAGAGPSSADIGLQMERRSEIRSALGPFVPVLLRMADSATATPSFRRQVRETLAIINS